jgi:hypothetical protein
MSRGADGQVRVALNRPWSPAGTRTHPGRIAMSLDPGPVLTYRGYITHISYVYHASLEFVRLSIRREDRDLA